MQPILNIVATAILTVLVVLAVFELAKLFRLLYDRGGRLRGWFAKEARWFDRRWVIILLGVVLPLACFVFDPYVFRTSSPWRTEGVFENYRPFFYAYFAIGSVAFLWWRPAGPWLRGIHRACACAAVMLGVMLLPLSLLGALLFGLGLLGLSPLFIAVLHWRVAWLGAPAHGGSSWYHRFLGVTGFVFPSVLAFAFHVYTVDVALRRSERFADVSVAVTEEETRSLRALLAVAPTSSADVFVERARGLWSNESSWPVFVELDARYRSVTGHSLEDRMD